MKYEQLLGRVKRQSTEPKTFLLSDPRLNSLKDVFGGNSKRFKEEYFGEFRVDITPWNRCDVCGKFISISDFDEGKAVRRMISPDSDYSTEDFETLCKEHKNR